LQNGPLRTLVGDIIADLVVGQALAGKICEGWFLHDTITKLSAIVSEKVQPKTSGDELHDDEKNRLEKFGLLASQSKPQQHYSPSNDQSKISAWFWRIMQYGYLMYLFLRYVLRELQLVHHKPKRQQIARISTSSPTMSVNVESRTPSADHQQPRPVLTYGVYAMISTLLKLADRMPWLASMLAFLQHVLLAGVGQVGQLNSILDRYVAMFHLVCAALSPFSSEVSSTRTAHLSIPDPRDINLSVMMHAAQVI